METNHRFSTTSKRNLEQCHRDLKKIHEEAIKYCPVDYGINQGHRTYDKQLEYFLEGKSSIDPRTGARSKHMEFPSEATDIHVAESHAGDKLTWDKMHLTFIAGYLIALSHQLYKQGEICHVLRWGGNWDSDGVISLDQSLQDFPHFELIKP